MPNNFFSFKQFTIQQEHCAMKVCTDACVLGAFTAKLVENADHAPKHILDIGSGTGLLALMLAQKSAASIDAIEMNEAAAGQAAENFAQSPWAAKIHLMQGSIQQFISSKKYDLIISNPPFFEDDLRSVNAQKNEAKHDSSLTFQELVDAIRDNLAEDGFATVLLPYHRTPYFKNICEEAGLFVNHVMLLQQSPQHNFFRSIVVLAKQKKDYLEETLVIHDDQRQYSPAFTALLKDYYLKL